MRSNLEMLNRVACLDYPESDVDWLPPLWVISPKATSLCRRTSSQDSTKATQQHRNRPGPAFQTEVTEALKVLFMQDDEHVGLCRVQQHPTLAYGLKPSFVVEPSMNSVDKRSD